MSKALLIDRDRGQAGRVFIVDSDAAHAAALRHALESVGYDVAAYANERNVLEIIEGDCPDLVIMVPRSPATFGDALAATRTAVEQLEIRPELLFVLRWTPRGPAERLLGDRWKVQVIYER